MTSSVYRTSQKERDDLLEELREAPAPSVEELAVRLGWMPHRAERVLSNVQQRGQAITLRSGEILAANHSVDTGIEAQAQAVAAMPPMPKFTDPKEDAADADGTGRDADPECQTAGGDPVSVSDEPNDLLDALLVLTPGQAERLMRSLAPAFGSVEATETDLGTIALATTHEFEPSALVAELQGLGHPVPDSARVEITATGDVALRWEVMACPS